MWVTYQKVGATRPVPLIFEIEAGYRPGMKVAYWYATMVTVKFNDAV